MADDMTPDTSAAGVGAVTGAGPDMAPVSPAQPAQPGKPSLWRNVLEGALAGLQTKTGVISGALDPKTAITTKQNMAAMQQSKVKFANAQAAAEVADAATKDQQLHDLPQEQQDAHNESAEKVASGYTALFGNPTAVVNNTGPDAMQHMQTLSDSQGGVDHHLIVNTGGKLYLWNTEAAASSPDAWQYVKAAGSALGIAPLQALTPDSWKALPPSKKVQYMDLSDDLWNTVVPGKDLGTMNGQISRLTTAQQTLQQKVNSDPTVKPLLDTVNRNLEAVKANKDQFLKDQEGLAGSTAAARGKGYGQYRPTQVLKPNGELGIEYAKDAIASGAAPAAEGSRALAKGAQLGDIQQGSQNMRQAIGGLGPQDKFSTRDIAQLNLAMRSTAPITRDQIVDALGGAQRLSPAQQEFATALANLHERAMALRSVAGIGNQGSDAMRAAIVQMLPALKDPKALMLKKLDAFDQQLSILGRGIPKVKGANRPEPAAAAPKPAAPAAEPTATGPGGHKIAFRGGKWVDAQSGAPVQ